jgi:hypothetical protein
LRNRVIAAGGILAICAFTVYSISEFGFALRADPEVGPISPASASTCDGGTIGSFESDAPKDSRDQFLWEVQNAAPSPYTLRFSDRPDSYHVVKSDLAAGLLWGPHAVRDLRAVIVSGPKGVLWSYDILVISGRRGDLNVTRTHFAHARITLKGSAKTNEKVLRKLVEETAASQHILRTGPTLEQLRKDLHSLCWGEFNYDFLLALPSEFGVAFRLSSLSYAPDSYSNKIFEHLNNLIQSEEVTYRHGDAVKEPAT